MATTFPARLDPEFRKVVDRAATGRAVASQAVQAWRGLRNPVVSRASGLVARVIVSVE
jgi:hypothetical protein